MLKKLAAILLICLLLFNMIGYRLVIALMEIDANRQMITRIDDNKYDESELIEQAVPLNLPYFTDWHQFERCDGQITINGIEYNYVARKFCNNEMIYKCIPNEDQQKLKTIKHQLDNLALTDTENQRNKKAPTGQPIVKRLSEYNTINFEITHPPVLLNGITAFPDFTPRVPARNKGTIYHPPQV